MTWPQESCAHVCVRSSRSCVVQELELDGVNDPPLFVVVGRQATCEDTRSAGDEAREDERQEERPGADWCSLVACSVCQEPVSQSREQITCEEIQLITRRVRGQSVRGLQSSIKV